MQSEGQPDVQIACHRRADFSARGSRLQLLIFEDSHHALLCCVCMCDGDDAPEKIAAHTRKSRSSSKKSVTILPSGCGHASEDAAALAAVEPAKAAASEACDGRGLLHGAAVLRVHSVAAP